MARFYLALLLAQTVLCAQSPNIVFILVDDMGWSGTSIQYHPDYSSKSDYYHTPHLERLASQSLVFSQAYAPASMCTPSRASILTGKSPGQLHITSPAPGRRKGSSSQKVIPPLHSNSLPEKEITIAELLKQKGYRTAHFGKWHLHSNGPGPHGFDTHDGDTENDGPGEYEHPNPKDIFGITSRGITFMEQHKKTPFYLQLSHYAVHSPTKAKRDSVESWTKKKPGSYHKDPTFAAMTSDFDTSVGMILDTIDRLGLTGNTWVVFTSDNGGPNKGRSSQNHPLAGGKGCLLEGGVRVPLFIRGPGIVPIPRTEPVIGYDLFSTFCDIAGVTSLPAGVEGRTLTSLFSRPDPSFINRPLIFHNPHYGKGPGQKPESSLLYQGKKYLYSYEESSGQLFNLDNDISESKDLASHKPEITDRYKKMLFAGLEKVKAQFPTTNDNFDSTTSADSQSTKTSPFFRRYDKNGDGKVSSQELGSSHRLKRLDQNRDGYVTADEAPAPPGRR
ncbi:MAG: sulfatase-like hydrolase/transferase [Planctomycetes bacterium]|nr:sulfatase-like hydrolase/transferase [Planctomycetota bacterium]